MKILIKDPFDHYSMTIDLSGVCSEYGKKVSSVSRTGKTSYMMVYPKSRLVKLLNKIAHAIMWCICEEDPDEISAFFEEHNKDVSKVWEGVRDHYSI